MIGRVLKSTGSSYTVLSNNKIYLCKLSGKIRLEELKHTNPVSVGDEVKFSEENLIVEILERKNYLIRRSTNLSKQTHIIASNIDFIWIVACYKNPRTSTGFINRILITAEAYGIPAGIIYNKKDLLDKIDLEEVKALQHEFEKIGYPTLLISSFDKQDIETLKKRLINRTSLFAGHSGVGKSSLLNAIDEKLEIKTGEISQKHAKGTHTTTFAEMHSLKDGGFIIDTPGIKEFGLSGFEKYEIAEAFPEFVSLREYCKFNNCQHINEPGCAVIKGVEKNEIAYFRYNDYLNMIESNENKRT
jgi:ribosome biogenesis GTPase